MKSINLFLLFISFIGYSQKPDYSILITEIFADPTPSRGLPESEYLELFNNTDRDISLKSYRILNGKSEYVLPDKTIKRGQYLIVCRKGNELGLNQYGETLTLPVFSLNNSGSDLRILDINKSTVFEVSYQLSWYAKSKDQGYALEMIDTNMPCLESSNWTSSNSPIGGSPGKENSVIGVVSDIAKPSLLGYQLSANILSLDFDEKMDVSSLKDPSSFKFVESNFNVLNIQYISPNYKNVVLVLSDSLATNSQVNFQIRGLADCSGNSMDDVDILIGNFKMIEKGDLLVSEILFNPRGLGSDFVEIVNVSGQDLNLKDCSLGNLNSDDKLSSIRKIFSNNYILKTNDIIVVCEDSSNIIQEYPKSKYKKFIEIKDLPAYSNEKGTVILLNSEQAIIDSVYYNENMHSSLLKSFDGVSLERYLGNPISDFQSSSGNDNYASPGYLPKQNQSEEPKEFWIDSPIFYPLEKQKENTLRINYSLATNSNLLSIEILDLNGKIIKPLISNLLINKTGEFEWDGADSTGKLAYPGYYIILIKLLNQNSINTYTLKTVLAYTD